jgi:hypothetical protein
MIGIASWPWLRSKCSFGIMGTCTSSSSADQEGQTPPPSPPTHVMGKRCQMCGPGSPFYADSHTELAAIRHYMWVRDRCKREGSSVLMISHFQL